MQGDPYKPANAPTGADHKFVLTCWEGFRDIEFCWTISVSGER